MRFLTQWMRAPQKLWLRRAIFQIHLWSGIGLGVYMFVICLTGSVLVYRIHGLLAPARHRGWIGRGHGRGRTEERCPERLSRI